MEQHQRFLFNPDAQRSTHHRIFHVTITEMVSGNVVAPPDSWHYFSIKDALAHMLTVPLVELGPRSTLPLDGTYKEVVLADAAHQRTIASLQVVGRDHAGTRLHLPGIYLSCPQALSTLQIMTGWPVTSAYDKFLVRIAGFHDPDDRIEMTTIGQQLVELSAQHLRQRDELTGQFPFQLTYEGYYAKAHGDAGTLFIEHHHFTDLREALLALLQTNLLQFDSFLVRNETRVRYSHAYIEDAQGQALAGIAIHPISHVHHTPAAGIYLQTTLGLEELGKRASLDFYELAGDQMQTQRLLLAAYEYESGYRLKADEMVGDLAAHLAIPDTIAKGDSESMMEVLVNHQSRPSTASQLPFRNVTDYYHTPTSISGLQVLLSLSMIALIPGDKYDFSAYQAQALTLYSADKEPICYLDQVTHSQVGDVTQRIMLRIQHPMELEDDLRKFLMRLPGVMYEPGDRASMIIAEINPHGLLIPSPVHEKIQTFLFLMSDLYPLHSQAPPIPSIIDIPAAADSLSALYHVDLNWRLPGVDDMTLLKPERMPIHGLKAAYQTLLLLEKEIFIADPRWPNTVLLGDAILKDEQGEMIVRRYYDDAITGGVATGFHLAFNMHHPDGRRLAGEQSENHLRIQDTEGGLHIYQQHTDMLRQPERPRTFQDYQDRSQRPHH